MSAKKTLLTGLQPSGDLHIGNYFGALKPFVDTYEDYQSYLMVVDYHALTSLKDPEALRKNTFEVVRDYLAVGVDPEKAVISPAQISGATPPPNTDANSRPRVTPA